MRPTRKLALRRERLTELCTDDLRRIAGADADLSGPTCPVRDCAGDISDRLAACNSILRPCITWGTCTTY